MNQIIVIHTLLGNYSHIAGEIDKAIRETIQQNPDLKNHTAKEISSYPQKEPDTASEEQTKDKLHRLCLQMMRQNDNLTQENASLKEELNELYLMYDQMSAAFGEIQFCLQTAITAAGNMGKEAQP